MELLIVNYDREYLQLRFYNNLDSELLINVIKQLKFKLIKFVNVNY